MPNPKNRPIMCTTVCVWCTGTHCHFIDQVWARDKCDRRSLPDLRVVIIGGHSAKGVGTPSTTPNMGNRTMRALEILSHPRWCAVIEEMTSNKKFKLLRKKVEPEFDLRYNTRMWDRQMGHFQEIFLKG